MLVIQPTGIMVKESARGGVLMEEFWLVIAIVVGISSTAVTIALLASGRCDLDL